MKYIDADKLREQIRTMQRNSPFFEYPAAEVTDQILSFIDSLQQEQPITECNELEREYKRFSLSDHHQLQISLGNAGIDIARHFYELGINARKEESK